MDGSSLGGKLLLMVKCVESWLRTVHSTNHFWLHSLYLWWMSESPVLFWSPFLLSLCSSPSSLPLSQHQGYPFLERFFKVHGSIMEIRPKWSAFPDSLKSTLHKWQTFLLLILVNSTSDYNKNDYANNISKSYVLTPGNLMIYFLRFLYMSVLQPFSTGSMILTLLSYFLYSWCSGNCGLRRDFPF